MARDRMQRLIRAGKSAEEHEEGKKAARDGMEKVREEKTEEEKETDKLAAKLGMRKARAE